MGAEIGLQKVRSTCGKGGSEVHLQNGSKMKEMDESRYLGCFLNSKTDANRELNKIMRDVSTTWKRLGDFWRSYRDL